MVKIKHLEIHVAHICNLSCESCSHYSNQGHKGLVSLEEAEKWMKPYLKYKPLSPGCTDEQMKKFFNRKEEFYCGMCPASPEKFTPKIM